MKAMRLSIIALCGAMLLSACNLNNTAKGSMIGAAAGGAAGTGLGTLIGKLTGNTKLGAAIGAGAGVAVGTTAGALIGRKMDKAAAAAAAVANAEVSTYTDANGLEGVKVTFDNGILFSVGKYALTSSAKKSLKEFATNVLNVYTDADVNVYGFASSDGSDATNLTLSQNRANAVSSYLKSCNVNDGQIKTTKGFGEDPTYLITKSDGSEDVNASRRVEIYLYASEEMIAAANAGTLQ